MNFSGRPTAGLTIATDPLLIAGDGWQVLLLEMTGELRSSFREAE